MPVNDPPPVDLPPDPPADPPDPLNDHYLRLLREYDTRAVRYKRRRIWVWGLGLACTFAPLVLAIAGLAGWLTTAFGQNANHAVLKGVIPAIHTVGMVLVGMQLFVSYRGWWLRYRAAAERLRGHCMRFRARAAPYDGESPTPDQRFANLLTRLETEMNSTTGEGGDAERRRIPRRAWAALGLDRAAWERIPSPPDEGVRPRVGDPGTDPAWDADLVLNRLADQRQWHVRKAGYFYRRYVGWQLLLAATYLASMVYVRVVGHAFALVAVVAAIGLILTAIRDFMEYGPLSLRYAQLADALDRVAKEHPQPPAAADTVERREWQAGLAADVEDRLSSEFRAWYLVQEMIPTD